MTQEKPLRRTRRNTSRGSGCFLSKAQLAARKENVKKANAAKPHRGKQQWPLSELTYICTERGPTSHHSRCPLGRVIKRRSGNVPKPPRLLPTDRPFIPTETCWSENRQHNAKRNVVTHVKAGETTLCNISINDSWEFKTCSGAEACLAMAGCARCQKTISKPAKP